jgi:acetamidase/formamidase
MDVADLVAGSVLYLPVEAQGALFSIGDTHAAQGDGEVCGTAIESPMQVTATLDVLKGQLLAMPRIDRAAPSNLDRAGRVWITSGIGPDLHEAARAAVRGMIDLLGRERQLQAIDAYMLASVAGDLKIRN